MKGSAQHNNKYNTAAHARLWVKRCDNEGEEEKTNGGKERKQKILTSSPPTLADEHQMFFDIQRVAYGCVNHPALPEASCLPCIGDIGIGCDVQ